MSRLDEAATRLAEAVEKLERVSGETLSADEEVEMLTEELAVAREDYEELSRTTDQVSERLDSAIGRLKFVLES